MPTLDNCTTCGTEVIRTAHSAKLIRCQPCRKHKQCGTVSNYSAGCRCQPCRDAKAKAMRVYVARRKAEGRPIAKRQWRAYETLSCDCCAATFSREKRNDKRYSKAFCTLLCRDFTFHGPRTSTIPKTHLIYMVGQTSAWPRVRTRSETTHRAEEREAECQWCTTPFTTRLTTQAYCSRTCKERAGRAKRRAREAGATGTYRWGDVVKLWASFGKQCAYCRTTLKLDELQAEHVIALARGGANNLGNILPSCGPCNSDKRDLTMTEWAADRERRNLQPVTTQWQWSDPLYKHLTPAPMSLAA